MLGLHAIATEACRRAANGAEFLDLARAETGLPISVITPREEVELALESCSSLLPIDRRRVLLFDIGGGSTELAWVRLDQGRPHLIGYESLPVGVVTLSEAFGAAASTTAGFHRMLAESSARLAAFEGIHRIAAEIRHGGVLLLGHQWHRHHPCRHRPGPAALPPRPRRRRPAHRRSGGPPPSMPC